MDYRPLGRTGLKVSAICLGTMTFGEQNTEAEGHAQMDMATDHGVNFLDTAELYPIPPKADTQGRTEEIIGTWMKARGNRDKIIVATKVVGRSQMRWFRGETATLSRAHIRAAVEGSLRRLQTDYIDLYQTHWPDRPVNMFGNRSYPYHSVDSIAIEETLAALSELITDGKIRHIGLSNETPWGVMAHLRAADQGVGPRVASIQNCYNLLTREFETGLSEIAHREQVGLLAYSPLAQGYLTGKYQGGALPEGSRKKLFQRLTRYETPPAEPAITAYLALAQQYGLDPSQMANQFVTSRPFVTSNIIGATSLAQLELALTSVSLTLTKDILAAIEAIHVAYPNPAC